MRQYNFKHHFGFTLVELLIVVALVAIVLTLAAPSFREMIEMQRLKAIAAQVVTDVQFARSEAASRQQRVYVSFRTSTAPGMSCYIVHTCRFGDCECNCVAPINRCGAQPDPFGDEVRTVQVTTESGVAVNLTPAGAGTPALISFDPTTGGMSAWSSDPLAGLRDLEEPAWVDTSLTRADPPVLRTRIALSGRPEQCAATEPVSGFKSCNP